MILMISMINKNDAYGQEVWDYLKNKDGFEIIERDDDSLWQSSGPKSYFDEYKDWPLHEKKAMRYVKGNVLDIGCGAGRVCLYLQRKGINILGIDNSPLAIKTCKKRGVDNVKLLSIKDINKLKTKFDTIIMLGNNFGLFGNINDTQEILEKMYEITSKDAIIIAESTDPYQTEEQFNLDYHKFNLERGRLPGQLRLRVRFKKYVGDWFDYLTVSKEEMEKIVENTGWKIKRFINSEKSIYVAIIEKTK